MSSGNRHPNKDVEKALRDAEDAGWKIEARGKRGHAWGRLHCPHEGQDRCQLLIYATPRNAYAHARAIRTRVKNCPHTHEETPGPEGPPPTASKDLSTR